MRYILRRDQTNKKIKLFSIPAGGDENFYGKKAEKENGACWEEGDCNFLGWKCFIENAI